MQNKWYADAKDVVKWGGLAHICQSSDIRKLLHVMMYRKSDPFRLMRGDEEIDLCDHVWNHFRNPQDIRRLGRSLGIEMVLHDKQLPERTSKESRRDYFDSVCDRITREKGDRRPLVVFLDPDTGLEPPRSRANWNHVTAGEVERIYGRLSKGDVLALFQHGPQNAKGQRWKEDRQRRFAQAVKPGGNAVGRYYSPDVSGVVLFSVPKQ